MTFRPLLLACLLGVSFASPVLAAPRAPAKPVEVKAKPTSAASGTVTKKSTPAKSTPAKPKRKAVRPSRGRRVAQRATGLVGASLSSYHVPDDCSGLVRLAYQSVGVELLSQGTRPGENAASAMYRRAQAKGALHRKAPQPGDVIFFRETYDRNRDGLRNDGVTHVGVIESVARDGTVVFVHRGGKGVGRARMNLRHAGHQGTGGRVLNDYIRKAEQGDRARLTSELFVGYASSGRL
ncbi:CHAP domain-containing protein [Cystobacter fuscus]|uniref:CHAP domain-containing protein n=1 Tax=Cystobacter fuscus TaxID=43 RepID=UPI0037C0FDDC